MRLAVARLVLLTVLAFGCGTSNEDCAGGCPAGETCFYGVCIPSGDAGDVHDDLGPDAAADADGDADSDLPAEAEAAADDGGRDDGTRDDGGRDDGGCVPTGAETCNGLDDNCDTVTDEGYACAAGSMVACTTSCGTGGQGPCSATCGLPATRDCAARETCNGADDDCDTCCDNGFACCGGTTVSCTTWCGTAGSVACSAACLMPGTCTPPEEVCGNLVDDDCDTIIDQGCGGTNDTCASPLDVSAGGTFTGSTVGMTNDAGAPSPCVTTDPATPAPDAFFFFDLTETSDVFVNSSGSTFDTVVYLDRTCGGGALGCNDDMDPPGGPGSTAYLDSGVVLRGLAAGRYFITLDGWAADQLGDYLLNVSITPTDTDGDRCGSPIHILPGTTTLSGDTCVLSDETTGTCGGARAEAIYWFTIGAARTVTFSTCSAATTLDSILHLRSDCASDASQIACSNSDATCTTTSGAARISQTLEPGLYYLFVDGTTTGAGCGAYQLTVAGL